jgi:hypothetical protein
MLENSGCQDSSDHHEGSTVTCCKVSASPLTGLAMRRPPSCSRGATPCHWPDKAATLTCRPLASDRLASSCGRNCSSRGRNHQLNTENALPTTMLPATATGRHAQHFAQQANDVDSGKQVQGLFQMS